MKNVHKQPRTVSIIEESAGHRSNIRADPALCTRTTSKPHLLAAQLVQLSSSSTRTSRRATLPISPKSNSSLSILQKRTSDPADQTYTEHHTLPPPQLFAASNRQPFATSPRAPYRVHQDMLCTSTWRNGSMHTCIAGRRMVPHLDLARSTGLSISTAYGTSAMGGAATRLGHAASLFVHIRPCLRMT